MLIKDVKKIINSCIQNIPFMDAFNITNMIIDYVPVNNIYWLLYLFVEEINDITGENDVEIETKGCFLANSPEHAWSLYYNSGIPVTISQEEFLANLYLKNEQKFYLSTSKIQYFCIINHYYEDEYFTYKQCEYKRLTKNTKRKQFIKENHRCQNIWFAYMLDILFDARNYVPSDPPL